MIEINKYIKVAGIVRLRDPPSVSGKGNRKSSVLPPADEDLLKLIVHSVQTKNSTRCTDDSTQLMKVAAP